MKRLRVILLFLLLGAIVNIAVAWGFAIHASFISWSEHDYGQFSGPVWTSETGACWFLTRRDFFGSTLLYGDAILEANQNHVRSTYPDIVTSHIPAWSHFVDPPTTRMYMVEYSRGWPFRTLLSTQTPTNIAIPNKQVWIVQVRSRKVLLPLAPIWSGVLFNTLFYGILLWLFIPGPFVFRSMIRRRRGLCLKCGYDLQGVDHTHCPECGEETRKGNPA